MLALMMGIMAIYLGFNALKRINHSIDEEFELCNNNIAVALVSGSFIILPGIF